MSTYSSITTNECDRKIAVMMREFLVENGCIYYGIDLAPIATEAASYANLGSLSTTSVRSMQTPEFGQVQTSFSPWPTEPELSPSRYSYFSASGGTRLKNYSSVTRSVRGIALVCESQEIILYCLNFPDPVFLQAGQEMEFRIDIVFDALRG